MKRTIEIRMAHEILDMVEKNELKTYWTMDEKYDLDRILVEVFSEALVYEEVGMTIAEGWNVLEGYLKEDIYFSDIHVEKIYIHKNNDIVLMGDGDIMLIIKSDNTCLFMIDEF